MLCHPEPEMFSGLWINAGLGKRVARFQFHCRHIHGIDGPVPIHALSEIGSRDWLPGLRLDLNDIRGIDASVSVRVTQKHSHWDHNTSQVNSIIHARKRNAESLVVRNTGKIDCAIPKWQRAELTEAAIDRSVPMPQPGRCKRTNARNRFTKQTSETLTVEDDIGGEAAWGPPFFLLPLRVASPDGPSQSISSSLGLRFAAPPLHRITPSAAERTQCPLRHR